MAGVRVRSVTQHLLELHVRPSTRASLRSVLLISVLFCLGAKSNGCGSACDQAVEELGWAGEQHDSFVWALVIAPELREFARAAAVGAPVGDDQDAFLPLAPKAARLS